MVPNIANNAGSSVIVVNEKWSHSINISDKYTNIMPTLKGTIKWVKFQYVSLAGTKIKLFEDVIYSGWTVLADQLKNE